MIAHVKKPSAEEILHEIYQFVDDCYSRDADRAVDAISRLLLCIETQRILYGDPLSEIEPIGVLSVSEIGST